MHGERRERYKDLVLAGVLALIGIGGFLFINPRGAQSFPGPGGLTWKTLPFIYSSLLLVLVVIFVLSTLYDLKLLSRGEVPRSLLGARPVIDRDPVSDGRRLLTLACLIGYAAGLKYFGFAISTPLLLFVMLRVLGRRNHAANAAVAVVGGLLLWILFIGILKLPISGSYWDPLTPVLNELYAMTGAR